MKLSLFILILSLHTVGLASLTYAKCPDGKTYSVALVLPSQRPTKALKLPPATTTEAMLAQVCKNQGGPILLPGGSADAAQKTIAWIDALEAQGHKLVSVEQTLADAKQALRESKKIYCEECSKQNTAAEAEKNAKALDAMVGGLYEARAEKEKQANLDALIVKLQKKVAQKKVPTNPTTQKETPAQIREKQKRLDNLVNKLSEERK